MDSSPKPTSEGYLGGQVRTRQRPLVQRRTSPVRSHGGLGSVGRSARQFGMCTGLSMSDRFLVQRATSAAPDGFGLTVRPPAEYWPSNETEVVATTPAWSISTQRHEPLSADLATTGNAKYDNMIRAMRKGSPVDSSEPKKRPRADAVAPARKKVRVRRGLPSTINRKGPTSGGVSTAPGQGSSRFTATPVAPTPTEATRHMFQPKRTGGTSGPQASAARPGSTTGPGAHRQHVRAMTVQRQSDTRSRAVTAGRPTDEHSSITTVAPSSIASTDSTGVALLDRPAIEVSPEAPLPITTLRPDLAPRLSRSVLSMPTTIGAILTSQTGLSQRSLTTNVTPIATALTRSLDPDVAVDEVRRSSVVPPVGLAAAKPSETPKSAHPIQVDQPTDLHPPTTANAKVAPATEPGLAASQTTSAKEVRPVASGDGAPQSRSQRSTLPQTKPADSSAAVEGPQSPSPLGQPSPTVGRPSPVGRLRTAGSSDSRLATRLGYTPASGGPLQRAANGTRLYRSGSIPAATMAALRPPSTIVRQTDPQLGNDPVRTSKTTSRSGDPRPQTTLKQASTEASAVIPSPVEPSPTPIQRSTSTPDSATQVTGKSTEVAGTASSVAPNAPAVVSADPTAAVAASPVRSSRMQRAVAARPGKFFATSDRSHRGLPVASAALRTSPLTDVLRRAVTDTAARLSNSAQPGSNQSQTIAPNISAQRDLIQSGLTQQVSDTTASPSKERQSDSEKLSGSAPVARRSINPASTPSNPTQAPTVSSGGASEPSALHTPAAVTTPAALGDRFLAELAQRRSQTTRILPTQLQPLARQIVGDRAVRISTGSASQAALKSVGKVAATTGNTVHLARKPDTSSKSVEVLAHELTHVAHPSPAPRFFDDDHHSAEERKAEIIGQIMAKSTGLPTSTQAAATSQALGPAPVQRRMGTANLTVGAPMPKVNASQPSTPAIANAIQRTPATSSSGGVSADDMLRNISEGRPMPRSGSNPSSIQREIGTQTAPTSAPVTTTNTDSGGGAAPKGPTLASLLQQADSGEFQDFVDLIVDVLEERVMTEVDRRGGPLRGGF